MPQTNRQLRGPLGKGLLIAFMGLPGSGKSSTARALSRLIPNSSLFPEPEEDKWPPAVLDRHKCGYLTAITWFRSMRVPSLYTADVQRQSGTIAIVDSYYDKLTADYIDHPAMAWLIPQDDMYYSAFKQVAVIDKSTLPIADCLIFLNISPDVWKKLLSTRQRAMEQEELFLKSFPSQERFLAASRAFANETHTPLIVHEQQVGSADATAQEILLKLRDIKLLT
jgi:deoxyadenosine/deoxycytidine kinase